MVIIGYGIWPEVYGSFAPQGNALFASSSLVSGSVPKAAFKVPYLGLQVRVYVYTMQLHVASGPRGGRRIGLLLTNDRIPECGL